MASSVSTSANPPVNRPNNTGNRPPQPNLLHNPDEVSDSDDEEPPPYSRYDPLSPHPTPQEQQQHQPPFPPRPNATPHQQQYPTGPQQSYHGYQPGPIAPESPQGSYQGTRPLSSGGAYAPPVVHGPPRQQSSPMPNPPFQYPPGYLCSKCHNTGIKPYGSPCGTCARLFGRQTAQVRVVPQGYSAVPPPNALVVPAGDPRLGGVLCGNCKGTGRVVSLLFFDENCPVYHVPP